MSEKPFMGNTTQRVDDLGDGSHVPVVKLYGGLSLAQSEDLGTGTKYIMKSDGTNWLMVRKTYTDTASQLAYASAQNNAGTTLANAWGNRASLVYGAADADDTHAISDLDTSGLTNAELRAAAVVFTEQWEDCGYVLDASGNLTGETQRDIGRGVTRTRTWTYSTDGSGNVTATAGAWA